MPLLTWKTEYSVNDAELDRHHITMFDMLNMVYESVINNKDINYINQLVDVLAELLTCHLAAEEKHMRNRGYSGIDAHIAEHVKFKEDIDALAMNFHNNSLDTAKEIIVMLGSWLMQHVLTEDKKYSLPE